MRQITRGFSAQFKVLGVQQVALGHLDKAELTTFWGKHMGLTSFVKTFKSERENVDEDVYTVGKGPLGTIELDLMAPIDPEKSPKVHKPALNHIGLWVDNLENAVQYCEENELKIVGGIRPGASGYDVTFIHPKSACGVLVELVQAPEEIIKAYQAAEIIENHTKKA